ncbi:hypothetical protein ACLOJK_000989 [Asimina triloba]
MEFPETEGEDLSPPATVIAFHPPVPLLRGPIPAGISDDPSVGPFVLAFEDEASWRSAFRATESKIIEQCEDTMIGISMQLAELVGSSIAIHSSSKCKPPWWKSMFGLGSMDLSEREQCEEREMSVCLAAAKESCLQLAKEKCLPAFRDARIVLPDWNRLGELQQPTISTTSSPSSVESKSVMLRQLSLGHSSECYPQATNYKGHVLLEGTISLGTSKEESS